MFSYFVPVPSTEVRVRTTSVPIDIIGGATTVTQISSESPSATVTEASASKMATGKRRISHDRVSSCSKNSHTDWIG